MNASSPRTFSIAILLAFGLGAVCFYAFGVIYGRLAGADRLLAFFSHAPSSQLLADADDNHAHDEHGHSHTEDSVHWMEISDLMKKNLGLTDEYLRPIVLQEYAKSIVVPALVVEVPGRTHLPVSATTTGIVTHVHALPGEAVKPGDLLMEIRLTHEDLVTAQKEYLQALGDLDVERKEIARLESATATGAVSNKSLLERQYSRDKLESLLRSQREALRLHGLLDTQIVTIDTTRRLFTDVQVVAPYPDDHSEHEANPNQTRNADWLIVQELNIQKGQVVNTGERLCTLADYQTLLIEGQAFEADVPEISEANHRGWSVTAFVDDGKGISQIRDLQFAWIGHEIDTKTRILQFYVSLPNSKLDESRQTSAQRFVHWKYKVGQRMQLHVPVEKWDEQIVLPSTAVVRDGLESFVFQQNGDKLERIAVHEKHRDPSVVVLENDGTLYPGDIVALRGAHQLHMAIKNKAGSGIDPHAGHSH